MRIFGNDYNLKIIAILISVVFLCNNMLFAHPSLPQDSLRVPVGIDTPRAKTVLEENEESNPLSIEGELVTAFGPNHVYTLSEASEVAALNSNFVFLSFPATVSPIIDLEETMPPKKGMDDEHISGWGRKLLAHFKEVSPFKLQGVVPILLQSSNGNSTKLVFLFAVPIDQIESTDVMYQQKYYTDFEKNPSGNRKLEDSLGIWADTPEFANLSQKGKVRILVLGISYSGNYVALARQLEGKKINGSIVVGTRSGTATYFC